VSLLVVVWRVVVAVVLFPLDLHVRVVLQLDVPLQLLVVLAAVDVVLWSSCA
jgi:hypothetical protein